MRRAARQLSERESLDLPIKMKRIDSCTRAALALAFALSGALLATAAVAASAPEKAASAAPSAAATLYHNYCSVCHGDRGNGQSRATNSLSTRPRDFTTDASRKELNRERVAAAIRNGVPGTAMAGWKSQLNDADIGRLADYVLSTFVNPTGDPRLAKGRNVYAASCSVCHGDKGQGAMWAAGNMAAPPRDFRSPQAAAELTRERMIASVTKGRPGTAMAAFGTQLKSEDIEAVVDYIRNGLMMPSAEGISGARAHGTRPSESQPAVVTPTHADMSLPLPRKLAGDPAKGKAFYESNCATCHGTKGDGQGPRAYFINPKPRNLTDEAARRTFNRPALYAAISEGKLGTEMPAWKQVLSEQEIANVAEHVFRDIIRGAEQSRAGPTAKR